MNFFTALRPSRRKRQRPSRACLRAECLEDRTVPTTFNVTTTLDQVVHDGKLSLREAINGSNKLHGVDIIKLPAGHFTTTIAGQLEDANATGDFDITDSVTIQGAGAGVTIIDGGALDRVFDVLGAAPRSIHVEIQGVTIRNGTVPGGGFVQDGGGILVTNADLVVRDSIITGNQAFGRGGGIANRIFLAPGRGGSGPLTETVRLLNTTVSHNFAGGNGGGLSVTGTSTLTLADGSAIQRNRAGGNGGGVEAGGVTIGGSTVSGNFAHGSGGGINAGVVQSTNNTAISGNFAFGNGGGIEATKVDLLNGTAITGNGNVSGGSGGGVDGHDVLLNKASITGNFTSGGNGGGIQAVKVDLTSSTVSGNSASVGGGIVATTANATNSTISGNTAASGGGIFATIATLTNTTVDGNSATTGAGGGIEAVTATLNGSTVSNNVAGSGGGVVAGTANLTNCTVSGNTAVVNGGGIEASDATLLNDTIAENNAHSGGGIFHDSGGTFSIRNTIIAMNVADVAGSGPDVSGAFTSAGHNLIGNSTGSTGFTNGVLGDMVGSAVGPLDPKLGPLANNGGPTKTMALLSNSKAIDHGDNTGVPGSDQRGGGHPRILDGNQDGSAVVDIGAFEFVHPVQGFGG
jgi:predicted outer membrane repeat protein